MQWLLAEIKEDSALLPSFLLSFPMAAEALPLVGYIADSTIVFISL